jgi:hypothetical protein
MKIAFSVLVLLVCIVLGEVFAVHSHYETATHLLDEAELHEHVGEKRDQIQFITKEIRQEAHLLRQEEEKLMQKIHQREAVKARDFWWFFHNDVVLKVEEKQLEVNAQERVVEQVAERIGFLWKKLKPLFGVRSRMFVSELLSSFFSVFFWLFSYVFTFAEFTLISFLFFGPIAFAVWSLFSVIGSALLPIALSVYWLLWVARLPFILIQYQPTTSEFFTIYGIAILLAFISMWIATSYVGRRGPVHITHRSKRTSSGESQKKYQ